MPRPQTSPVLVRRRHSLRVRVRPSPYALRRLRDRLEANLSGLMGPAVARRTGEIKLDKGVLRIRIESAPLRQELSYGKDEIIQRLNRKLESRIIKEIQFYG